VVTTRQDITADRVLISLYAAGADVLRLDMADWPSVRLDATCTGAGWTGTLTAPGRTVRLEEIDAVWWWHPTPAVIHAGRTKAEAQWASQEATAGLAGVLAALDCQHVNHPASTYAAQSKPDVLAQAVRCGLRVPDSWIGNHPPGAHAFATRGASGTVIKSVCQPVVQEDDGRRSTLYTRTVHADQLDDSVTITAHHLQHRVTKRFEVRLVVAGDEMLAARIDAHSPAARQDFRADYPSLTYSVVDVPEEVRSGVRRLMTHYGLLYAALDLLVTEAGTWWLVDLNPAGQWGWLQEQLPQLDIAGAMARLLTAGPRSRPGHPGAAGGRRDCTTPSAPNNTHR
jgi:hypothetical protein